MRQKGAARDREMERETETQGEVQSEAYIVTLHDTVPRKLRTFANRRARDLFAG